MTVCIQCAMRAMRAGLPAPTFTETPEEHARRVHPDAVQTAIERRQLEADLAATLRPGDRS